MSPMKKLGAIAIAAGLAALASVPAQADTGNWAAIDAINHLRYVDSVNVIDVGSWGDRWVYSKRAMHSNAPLTPLQVAIVSNPHLMRVIQATVWSFDLKSAYSARVDGNHVTIYVGDPPH
jgi:hypothetical protein